MSNAPENLSPTLSEKSQDNPIKAPQYDNKDYGDYDDTHYGDEPCDDENCPCMSCNAQQLQKVAIDLGMAKDKDGNIVNDNRKSKNGFGKKLFGVFTNKQTQTTIENIKNKGFSFAKTQFQNLEQGRQAVSEVLSDNLQKGRAKTGVWVEKAELKLYSMISAKLEIQSDLANKQVQLRQSQLDTINTERDNAQVRLYKALYKQEQLQKIKERLELLHANNQLSFKELKNTHQKVNEVSLLSDEVTEQDLDDLGMDYSNSDMDSYADYHWDMCANPANPKQTPKAPLKSKNGINGADDDTQVDLLIAHLYGDNGATDKSKTAQAKTHHHSNLGQLNSNPVVANNPAIPPESLNEI